MTPFIDLYPGMVAAFVSAQHGKENFDKALTPSFYYLLI